MREDIATGCDNTTTGWKLANKFWEQKINEIDAIMQGEKKAQDTIENTFNKFIEYKMQYDKISKNTIKLYNIRIKSVFNDLKINLNEKNIKNSLDNFIKNTNLSDLSINYFLTGIQTFLNWASDEDQQFISKKDYIKKYKQKPQSSIRPPYTEEEYKIFVDYFDKNHKEMSLFIQFLWNTGARGSEAINIKICDIDFKNNYILVSNKMYKSQQEMILLTDETKKIIQKIIALKNSKDGKLFSWKGATTPFQLLRDLENKLDIKTRGRGLHGFRRGFNDKLIRSGIYIQDAQHILRHRNITTTEKYYTNMYKNELVDKMNEKLKNEKN